MKKTFSLALCALLLPLSGFAQDKDFFKDALAPRITDCKIHFDIEPYFVIAMGAEKDERITPDVQKSIEKFGETGRIELPQGLRANPQAVACATYAEGLLAGAIGHQIVQALGKAVGEALSKGIQEALGKAMEEAIKSLGDGIGNAIQEPSVPEKR